MVRPNKTGWFRPVPIDAHSEKFFNALFLLNLHIDIDVDEELCLQSEATKPMADIDSFLGILLEHTDKHIILDETGRSLLKAVLGESQKLCEVTSNENANHLDLNLQKVVAEKIPDGQSLQEKRLVGLALLLIGKYVRAVCTASLAIGDFFNALSRFLLSHLSLVADSSGDRQDESFYLRLALLFEAAQCANPDSSLGILKIIEGMAKDQSKGNWHIKTIPYYHMLLYYNYALAYNHEDQRTKALQKTREVCREYDWINRKVGKNCLAAIARYLRLPALQQHADLLNKMQFCFNSIQTLKALQNAIEEMPPRQGAPCWHKKIRALLLEASCWYDMGDKAAAEGVIHKLEGMPRNYLGESLRTNLIEPDKSANNIADWEKCLDELDEKYPNLRMDAVKLLLQRDLEELRLEKNEKKETDFQKKCSKLLRLKITLENRREEPFQRQNLKELAIDWLARLVKVKEVNAKAAIFSRGWQDAITCALECLDIGPGDKRKNIPPYKRSGDISNEIWGKNFKRIRPTVRNRFFGILEKIIDKCEKDLAKSAYSSPKILMGKKLFEKLAEFELRALGLDPHNPAPYFQDEARRNKEETKEVYPKKDSYLFRKIKRRGAVLLRYIKATSNRHWLKDLNNIKEQFLWINQDPGSEHVDPSASSIGNCLGKTVTAWSGRVKLDLTGKGVPLQIGDYKHIINDSDFTSRLKGGRTVQPVHFPKDEKKVGLQFVALRRWNSYTPEISFSRGGGYFLFLPNNVGGDDRLTIGGVYRKTRLGVVVDPGFDFIHNFFSQGFSLDDIDVVVITHADADHINDFRGLADLLREREKRDGEDAAKIYTFMPHNTRKLLERYITDEAFRRLYYDTVLVDLDENLGGCSEFYLRFAEKQEGGERLILRDSEENGSDVELVVRPVEASHDDHAGDTPSAYGYILEFQDNNKATLVGFTGDSQWFPGYAKHFKKCHLICSHMGSPLGDEYENYDDKKISVGTWEALVRKKNHPYLPGTILFLEQLRKQQGAPKDRIVVLSEFGEEMKGMMRKDICARLNLCLRPGEEKLGCWSAFVGDEKDCEGGCRNPGRHNEGDVDTNSGSLRVIPADVGLRVSILDGHDAKIHCVLCEGFHDPSDVQIVAHGPEEAYFFICGPCARGKSEDVKVARYETLLEHGRPLRKA